MSMATLPTPPVAPVTDDRALVRRLPVLFHAMDGERGGIAGGADLHGLHRRHALGNRHEAVAREARVFGIAAIDRLAQPAAVDEDLCAGLEIRVFGADHDTGEVDAAIQRIASQYFAGTRRRERVLVIDR